MNRKITALSLLLTVTLSGCYSTNDLENPDRLSSTEVISTTAGTVLGGAAGYAISDGDDVETALGAVAGGATAYGLSNYYKSQAVTQHELEQKSQAYAPMVEDFEDAWDAQVQRPLEHTQTANHGHMAKYLQPIEYPAGVYEGIHYHNRTVNPNDQDPLNPER